MSLEEKLEELMRNHPLPKYNWEVHRKVGYEAAINDIKKEVGLVADKIREILDKAPLSKNYYDSEEPMFFPIENMQEFIEGIENFVADLEPSIMALLVGNRDACHKEKEKVET